MWDLKALFFIKFTRYAFAGRFYSLFILFQGLTFSQLGTILSIAYISRTIGSFFWSTIADINSKYNWRFTIPFITSCTSAIIALLLFLPHYILHYNSNNYQLFLYLFIIQIVWFLFNGAEWPIIIGMTMLKLSKTNSKIKYGIYRSYGAVSWGITHLVIGLLLQYDFIKLPYLIYMYSLSTLVFLVSYIYTFGIKKTSDTAKTTGLQKNYGSIETVDKIDDNNDDNDSNESKWQTFKYIMSNASRLSVFILLLCVGGGRDVLESFLFVFIYTKYEDNPFLYGVLGISVMITVTFEFPLFFKEKWFVEHLGFRKMMILGTLFLIVRFVAYTLLTEHVLIIGFLLIEFLHGLSFALIDMSIVTICSDLFPDNMQMIAQGILTITRMGIGPFVFVLLSGIVFDKFGGDWLFRGIAILEAIALGFFIILTRGNKLYIATERQLHSTKEQKV